MRGVANPIKHDVAAADDDLRASCGLARSRQLPYRGLFGIAADADPFGQA
jgi:hypothetical protein